MAIAFDAATDLGSTTGTSLTAAHTVGAISNGLLIVAGLGGQGASDGITGATYNGVAMTQACTPVNPNGGASRSWTYLWYLLNPATGSHNVVISASSSQFIQGLAASYSGVNQSGQPDNNTTHITTSTVNTLTTSLTTVADNCWTILAENSYNVSFDNLPATAGTGLTRRVFGASNGAVEIFDSGGVITPAGSYSMTTNRENANGIIHAVASFSPAGAAAPALIYRNQRRTIIRRGWG